MKTNDSVECLNLEHSPHVAMLKHSHPRLSQHMALQTHTVLPMETWQTLQQKE